MRLLSISFTEKKIVITIISFFEISLDEIYCKSQKIMNLFDL